MVYLLVQTTWNSKNRSSYFHLKILIIRYVVSYQLYLNKYLETPKFNPVFNFMFKNWWLLWYNVSKWLGNCDMRLSRYQLFSPYLLYFLSPSYVSVIWFQMWSLSLPYLSILLYTIHTLSCYLKWRSNLKFNTPDFNIHKTHKSCWDNKIVDHTSTRITQSLICP